MKKVIDLKLTNIINNVDGKRCRVSGLRLNNAIPSAPLVNVYLDDGSKFCTGADTEVQTYSEATMFANYGVW